METDDTQHKTVLRKILFAAFLLLSLALLLHGNAKVGLFESSEARYAEVAREMTATGNYLSPQMDYIYHFTKPPLAYWFTVAGYKLFGINTFGARFFLALAAIAVLLLTARIFAVGLGSGTGLTAAALLFFSIEFFALGKIVTTDMYLTLWITLGLFLWSLREAGKLSERNFRLLFGVAAALGFMTKGPVPLLFWAVVLVPYSLMEDRGRSLKALLSPWFWTPFLLLGLPWFVAVGSVHPGLLSYLLTHESAGAAYSAKRFHPGPWYYYIPILLAGTFPWCIVLIGRWRRLIDKEVRLWLLWAAAPILVWSIFPAKLPTYILPTMPAWALLAAWIVKKDKGRSRIIRTAVPLAMGCVGAAGLFFLSRKPSLPAPGAEIVFLLALSTVVGISGALWGLSKHPKTALVLTCVSMACIQLALPLLCVKFENGIKIRKRLGVTVASMRESGDAVLEYRTTLFSIPFYIKGEVGAYENNFSRHKYLEKKLPPHIIRSRNALREYVEKHPCLWVVTGRDKEKSLARTIPGLSLVMREGNHSLWAAPSVEKRLMKEDG